MTPPEPPRRRGSRLPAPVADGALAWLVIAAAIGSAVGHRTAEHIASRPVAAVLLSLAIGLPLLVRRRVPLQVLAVVEAGIALYSLLVDANPGPAGLGLAIAVYTVATRTPRRVSIRAALGVGGLNTLIYLGTIAAGRFDTATSLLFADVLVAGSWAIGDNIATRRAYLAALEDRAARLEREQQERAERAVVDERSRIARELHDIVAHHVSAIAVQAGAAEEVAETDPAAARRALGAIQATSREALTEMRALVGVLRAEASDPAGLAPQPGLAMIERLAAQTRAAGLDVAVQVEGAIRPLPGALDLSAFRIVQEALTNTLRHAHASRADVVVRYAADSVELEVSDDGTSAATTPPGDGRGLVGMRERVALFGGRLDVGRGPQGGFRVRALLPTVPLQA